MADCIHCDINDLVVKYLESQTEIDLADVVAKMAESVVDLIVSAPETEHAKLLADALAHFGQTYLEKVEAVEGGGTTAH